jgi:hypothetical protein
MARLPVDVETTLRWIASVKKEDYWTDEWERTRSSQRHGTPNTGMLIRHLRRGAVQSFAGVVMRLQ